MKLFEEKSRTFMCPDNVNTVIIIPILNVTSKYICALHKLI